MKYSLEQIDWCDVPLVSAKPDPEWERESARRIGKPTYVAQFVAPVRWLLEGDELMHSRVTPSVPVDMAMLIGLVVAMDNSCRHCYGAFRSMLRIMGYPERAVRMLEERLALDTLSPREKLALDFVRRVSRSDPRPSADDIGELRQSGYSPLEIAEMAYLAANNAVGNRLATLLALPPDPVEKLEANPWLRPLRPFARRNFRNALSAVRTVAGAADYSGPGAPVVRSLGDSPAGNALATVLHGAWTSTITTRRLKAVILAVISRGLDCPACEGEATRILREEGWSDDETHRLLTHLASNKLDPFELKALRFARETVRYQTRRLQDLAREFAGGTDRESFLEIVGLVSYYNGLARMSILLGHC